MKKIILIFVVFTIATTRFFAQENVEEKSNIQTFTPSKLLSKGQWDIKFFNGLYSETEEVDENGNKSSKTRATFFTNTTEVYTGVSEDSRINIGFIIQARSNKVGGEALDVINFRRSRAGERKGLSAVAPSIRVQPFKNIGNFSFTSSFFIPVFEDIPDTEVFFDFRSFAWDTKFFYDKTFGGDKWQLFTQLDTKFNFGEKRSDASPDENAGERFANNSLFLPVSAFLSYFPSSKSTVFINAQQAFLIDLGNDFEQNYTQLGFGAKYQITRVFNLEASYGKFVRGNSTGLGQTISFGVRALF